MAQALVAPPVRSTLYAGTTMPHAPVITPTLNVSESTTLLLSASGRRSSDSLVKLWHNDTQAAVSDVQGVSNASYDSLHPTVSPAGFEALTATSLNIQHIVCLERQ